MEDEVTLAADTATLHPGDRGLRGRGAFNNAIPAGCARRSSIRLKAKGKAGTRYLESDLFSLIASHVNAKKASGIYRGPFISP
jgi:hypothetical protein